MLQQAKFLVHSPDWLSCKTYSFIVLHFTDLAAAKECIAKHVSFQGQLRPATKFICSPPRCFNCHHSGHFARFCKISLACRLCAGNHDTCNCANANTDHVPDHSIPLKCAVCCGPHAVASNDCPARRAAIYSHWRRVADMGPFFSA